MTEPDRQLTIDELAEELWEDEAPTAAATEEAAHRHPVEADEEPSGE